MAFFFGVNKEVLPLKINLAFQARIDILKYISVPYLIFLFFFQEARLKSANNDLHRAQNTLIQKEEELSHVKLVNLFESVFLRLYWKLSGLHFFVFISCTALR